MSRAKLESIYKTQFNTSLKNNISNKAKTEKKETSESFAVILEEEKERLGEKSERCLLDDLMMPLCLGAGDARAEEDFIGEYAEKWNRLLTERSGK